MMVEVIDDSFMVCEECMMIIATGDYSHLQYDYDENGADERVVEIDTAIDQVEGEIVPGNSEHDEEFSIKPCECCKSQLAGSRHHCVILSN
jgi:hypothetical protein